MLQITVKVFVFFTGEVWPFGQTGLSGGTLGGILATSPGRMMISNRNRLLISWSCNFKKQVNQVVSVPFSWRGFEGVQSLFTPMGKEYLFDEQDVYIYTYNIYLIFH